MQNQSNDPRRTAITAVRAEITWLQSQLTACQRAEQALTGTPAATNARTQRQGQTSPRARTANGGGGGDLAFLTGLLKKHGEGLTAPQIREYTEAAGRRIPSNFYPGNLLNNAAGFTRKGEGAGRRYYLRAGSASAGMRRPMGRAGTASTRTRQRRTMTAGAAV